MPEWLHNRAEHILAKNPSMPKGEAFAIATQQSHALGKSPKGYGTSEGRSTAKAKFSTPKDDVKTSNPGSLSSPKMEKKGMDPMLMSSLKGTVGAGPRLGGQLTNVGQKFTGGAAGQVKAMARKGSFLQNAPAAPAMIHPLAVERDPFAKAAMMRAMSDEFLKISTEKDSGFMDSVKGILTTPIPGTPELLGGVKGGIEKATRAGGSGGGPSAGFLKFQQQRAAGLHKMSSTATVTSMAPPAPAPSAPRSLPPMNAPLMRGVPNVMFAPKPRGGSPAPAGMQ